MTIKIFNLLKKDFRIKIDNSKKSFGFKVVQSEIEGTPIRIEIGYNEIVKKKFFLIRRDNQEKILINFNNIIIQIKKILFNINNNLYYNAKQKLKNNIIEVWNYKKFKKIFSKNKSNNTLVFVRVPFAGNKKEEQIIFDETSATARCIIDRKSNIILNESLKKCFFTGKKTKNYVIFARSY